jgi:hypothetical protein
MQSDAVPHLTVYLSSRRAHHLVLSPLPPSLAFAVLDLIASQHIFHPRCMQQFEFDTLGAYALSKFSKIFVV